MSVQSPGPDGPPPRATDPDGPDQYGPDQDGPDQDGTDPRWRMTPTKWVVSAILLAAIVVPLLVGTYSRIEPRLFGFPFFYWYQLAWVFLAAACCATSFALLKREQRAYERTHPRPGHGPATTQGGAA